MHEDLSRTTEIEAGSERSFGWVFSGLFVLIACWPLLNAGPPRWWALIIAIAFAALALLRPRWLRFLNRLWFLFGMLLHRVLNPLIMAVMFYLVVTPTGLLMRLLGKDPLRLKNDPDTDSYWIKREPPGPAPQSLKNQF